MFQPGLGDYQGFRARIEVDPKALSYRVSTGPKRFVCYAPPVENELDRLVCHVWSDVCVKMMCVSKHIYCTWGYNVNVITTEVRTCMDVYKIAC